MVTKSMDNARLLGVAIQAALRAGDILQRGFRTAYQISVKSGIHNLVTQFDKAAEEAVIEIVKSHFPDHTFLAEESGGSNECPKVLWIIDPLDGTVNFIHHIPMFAVSIAAYAEGDVQVGVIYIPMLHELFVAEKGKGAFLNGSKITVSPISKLDEAYCFMGLPSTMGKERSNHLMPLLSLIQHEAPVRDLGSAAVHLAYVASGRADLFYIPRLQPWDMAAGKLLVEEAGGSVTHFDGTPHQIFPESSLLATNKKLHSEALHWAKKDL